MVNAPFDELTGKIVAIIRQVRPQVILTHDPCGDYGHPDHIAVNKAATAAFLAAGDPAQYLEAGEAFKPQKLFYSVFPRRMLKIAVKVLPLLGRDPKHFGRNKDIDLTQLTAACLPVNAVVKLTRSDLKTRDMASNCHRSQLDGGPPRQGILSLIEKLFGRRDSFTLADPLPAAGIRENGLF